MVRPAASRHNILIADDDEFVREHLRVLLETNGYRVLAVNDGADAISGLGERFDAAILDLNMPGASGLEVLGVAQSKRPDLPVIMLSGEGEAADAVAALKRGAFDYITKPFDPEELLARVREATRVSRLESENESLRAAQGEVGEPVEIIAVSELTRSLLESASRCAGVDSTVLVTGPSGTGKSVLARWIHQRGPRKSSPFITVNCGAIPRELIESELFGHEKGAFTGATSTRAGKFESADGGTLFLDEVGELPLDLQPKLLSVLQDRRVCRVGSSEESEVDVRVIAATNRDLAEAVGERVFREDLFYRLNVLTLELPALRVRPEDIVPIAEHAVSRIARRLGRDAPVLEIAAAERLRAHQWPGNVRELENVLERAMVFASGATIDADSLGSLGAVSSGPLDSELVGLPLDELEKRAILATLEAFGGNRAEAANALGVSERTIYNRLREYGRPISPGEPDAG
ncbi:MAG: sigma-54 dependent transcriptional regulator [Planctomycetota bacterium]